VVLLAGCKDAPKVTVCISDPGNLGFQCKRHDRSEFFLPYDMSENYVALSPRDAEQLLNYCKIRGEEDPALEE